MNDHQRGSSSSRPSSAAYPQGSANQDANQIPGGQWYYNPAAGQVDQPKPTQTVQSSSSMIGPTSTFYNPNDNFHAREDHGPYQQWLDSFGSSSQSQSQMQSTPFQSQEIYRRNPAQSDPQAQVQTSYQFLSQQYTPPSSMVQYAQPMPTSMPPPPHVAAINPPQGADMFRGSPFYSDLLTLTNTSGASTPDHGQSYTPESTLQSYSSSPDPAFQQLQPQQPQQPQQTQQPAQQQQQPQHQQQQAYSVHSQQQAPLQTQQPQPRKANPTHLNTQFQQPQQSHFQRFVSQSGTIPQTSTGARSQQRSTNSTLPAASPQQWSNEAGFSNNAAGPSSQTGTSNARPSKTPPQSQPAVQAPRKADPPPQKKVASTSAPQKLQGKRKRTKIEEIVDWQANDCSDSESESDDETGLAMSGRIRVGLGGLGIVRKGGKREKGARLPGACKHCKKLKMKCDFPPDDSNTCKRCKQGSHVCVVEGRKPRTAPNKREYLLAQIRQKDTIIESLLKQLHNPYTATPLSIQSYCLATSPSDQNNDNVLSWLDKLQRTVQHAGKKVGPQAFLNPQNDHLNEEDSEDEDDAKRMRLGQNDAGDTADGHDGSETVIQSALPDAHVPLGLIADLSLSNNRKGKKKDKKAGANDEDNDDNVGVANAEYFAPGPATDLGKRATLIEQHSPPEILVHGLVNAEDVEKLFAIFYESVNPFISLLDPVLHTPGSTFHRCPFLFTVICAISSRYYKEKSEIYPIAMHFAKHSAANALIDGWKSVELCQAYILMSIYAMPARRWEEDRSWLYTGLAIRIATDLNLHQVSTVKPQSERQEREIMNKTRVWMICFNLDRSTATQFGKPSTIKEDYIVRNAKEWYKKSQYNHCYDVHLCAYSALLQIVAKFHDEIFSDPSAPTGLNKKVDFKSVTLVHDQHLTNYHNEWAKQFDEDSDKDDPSCVFRCSLLPFLVSYSRLVMFSFGFQQAFQRGLQNEDRIFFDKCMESAKSVIEIMINSLAPSGYMRYAPDGHFIFASFAAAFLLKLLRPETSSFLLKSQVDEILDLIRRLISTLSSVKIAIDDRHTPKLYARFLASRLQLYRPEGATLGRLHTNPPPPSQVPPTGSAATTGAAMGMNSFSLNRPPSGNDPVYAAEATFAGAGPITFTSDLDMTYVGVSEEEMLATMQAIKNPDWWQNMMMPGFSWPEASPSPPAHSQPVTSNFHSHPLLPPAIPGLQGGFGMFHSAQVMM